MSRAIKIVGHITYRHVGNPSPTPSLSASSVHHDDDAATIKNGANATSSSLLNVSSTPTRVSINVATPTSTPSSSVIDTRLPTHSNFPLESPQHPPHSSPKHRQGFKD
ncbi:hypothetical protein BDQ17DRAFT_1437152 [Cyathus striatus]|nr:hypothetical protein BDQ17DRAFT_1437152 [Cyathus striatus]